MTRPEARFRISSRRRIFLDGSCCLGAGQNQKVRLDSGPCSMTQINWLEIQTR